MTHDFTRVKLDTSQGCWYVSIYLLDRDGYRVHLLKHGFDTQERATIAANVKLKELFPHEHIVIT